MQITTLPNDLVTLHEIKIQNPHPPEIDAFQRSPLTFYVSLPKNGITANTIPILALHGHGEMGRSEYLKSLHESVSSKLNALVISVEYLGLKSIRSLIVQFTFDEWALKQTNINLARHNLKPLPESIINDPNPFPKIVEQIRPELDIAENPIPCITMKFPDDHYDFGLIQAIDCLWAVKVTKDLYPHANWSKLSAVGLSHGGYLATQCARFAPNTFALIVNGYGWTKPFLPWMIREYSPKSTVVQNKNFLAYTDNYWRIEKDHPHFLSPSRLMIRTQDNIDQLLQWRQQQLEQAPLFIMTQQLQDEMHPLSQKQELIKLMNEAGFNLKDYLNPSPNNTYRSLEAGDKTSFKGFIYDFVTEENLKNNRVSLSDFERKNVIAYQCGKSMYLIDYTEGLPRLKIY